MLLTLAGSIAGVGDAHQARGKLVAEVALQDSFFDQHGFLRRLSFVVYVERTATPRHSSVVDHRAAFAGHALADQAGKSGRFLAIEISFQPVSNRLVQEDARSEERRVG